MSPVTYEHTEPQSRAAHGLSISVEDEILLAWLITQLQSAPERLLAVFAGAERQFLAAEVLAQGTCQAVRCSWRGLFARALAHDSRAILLAHNHPSGSAQPSRADLAVTRQIDQMAGLLGISLIDHLIIAGGKVHSICQARQL